MSPEELDRQYARQIKPRYIDPEQGFRQMKEQRAAMRKKRAADAAKVPTRPDNFRKVTPPAPPPLPTPPVPPRPESPQPSFGFMVSETLKDLRDIVIEFFFGRSDA